MVETTVGIQGKFLEYKGKPLVRQEDELYYGNMSDKFILFMLIMSTKEDAVTHTEVPEKVMIQIKPTDGSNGVQKQKIVDGLYEALDLGSAWLERANRE